MIPLCGAAAQTAACYLKNTVTTSVQNDCRISGLPSSLAPLPSLVLSFPPTPFPFHLSLSPSFPLFLRALPPLSQLTYLMQPGSKQTAASGVKYTVYDGTTVVASSTGAPGRPTTIRILYLFFFFFFFFSSLLFLSLSFLSFFTVARDSQSKAVEPHLSILVRRHYHHPNGLRAELFWYAYLHLVSSSFIIFKLLICFLLCSSLCYLSFVLL